MITRRSAGHRHEAARRRCVLASVCALSLSTIASSKAGAPGLPPKLVDFLQTKIGLSAQELASVANGSPVVKVLGDSEAKEIAIVGAVQVHAPRSLYVEQVTDSLVSLHDPSRLGFGIFSNPAAAGDVATLTLPHDDVQDLAKCRPGSCKLKLPAQSITDLRSTIDPQSPSADSVATAYVIRHMIAYITAYRARGKEALVVYDDQSHPIASSDVWSGILSRSPYMYDYAPSLARYLTNYPADRPASARDTFSWAEHTVPHATPMLTMTHHVVYQPPELPGTTLIAAQLLYSDHFLDGALDLTAVIDLADDATGSDTAGIAVVMLRRLHFDDLPSGGILNVRGRVIGNARQSTETFLRDTKRRSETQYAAVRNRSS